MVKFYSPFFLFLFIYGQLEAQIFGNTINNDDEGLSTNYITAWRIDTGPSDSGNFTHIAIADATGYNQCDLKLGIYSHNTTTNRPDTLMTDIYVTSPVDGQFNLYPLTVQPVFHANSSYYIAIRADCTYHTGSEANSTWPFNMHYFWIPFGDAWDSPWSGTSNFSGAYNGAFYLVGNNQTLPAELISFTVEVIDQQSQLNWITSGESNNLGWNIQRSINGFKWEKVGFVDGKGDAIQDQGYSFIDRKPISNRVFYRLEQMDIDGALSYSEIKSVFVETDGIQISPNPASNEILLNGNFLGKKYLIVDITGKRLKEGELIETNEIDITELNEGNYFLKLIDINEVVQFTKL